MHKQLYPYALRLLVARSYYCIFGHYSVHGFLTLLGFWLLAVAYFSAWLPIRKHKVSNELRYYSDSGGDTQWRSYGLYIIINTIALSAQHQTLILFAGWASRNARPHQHPTFVAMCTNPATLFHSHAFRCSHFPITFSPNVPSLPPNPRPTASRRSPANPRSASPPFGTTNSRC